MFEFLPIFILERFHVSFFFSFQHIANGLYLHEALGYLALLHRRCIQHDHRGLDFLWYTLYRDSRLSK